MSRRYVTFSVLIVVNWACSVFAEVNLVSAQEARNITRHLLPLLDRDQHPAGPPDEPYLPRGSTRTTTCEYAARAPCVAASTGRTPATNRPGMVFATGSVNVWICGSGVREMPVVRLPANARIGGAFAIRAGRGFSPTGSGATAHETSTCGLTTLCVNEYGFSNSVYSPAVPSKLATLSGMPADSSS